MPIPNVKHPTTKKHGFTLIEILLLLVFILALVAILFSTSGTFAVSRSSNLQGIATKIASREVENLRKTDFAALPSTGSISDSDLSKLPQGSATRTVTDYQGNTKIKQVTIEVDWVDKGVPKNVKVETLIAENGL